MLCSYTADLSLDEPPLKELDDKYYSDNAEYDPDNPDQGLLGALDDDGDGDGDYDNAAGAGGGQKDYGGGMQGRMGMGGAGGGAKGGQNPPPVLDTGKQNVANEKNDEGY